MGQERRHFTDEFKTQAVALLASSGRPLVQIAGELGISPSMLRNWRTAAAGRKRDRRRTRSRGWRHLPFRIRRRKSPGCAARMTACAGNATF
jgi:transposase-like protein